MGDLFEDWKDKFLIGFMVTVAFAFCAFIIISLFVINHVAMLGLVAFIVTIYIVGHVVFMVGDKKDRKKIL